MDATGHIEAIRERIAARREEFHRVQAHLQEHLDDIAEDVTRADGDDLATITSIQLVEARRLGAMA